MVDGADSREGEEVTSKMDFNRRPVDSARVAERVAQLEAQRIREKQAAHRRIRKPQGVEMQTPVEKTVVSSEPQTSESVREKQHNDVFVKKAQIPPKRYYGVSDDIVTRDSPDDGMEV